MTGTLVVASITQASAQDTTMHLTLKQSLQLGLEKNVSIQNAGLEQQKIGYQLT